MLAVDGGAVLRSSRAAPAPIGIGALLRSTVCAGVRVVRLTDALTAVTVRDCGATCVCSGGRVVASAGVRGAVGAIGGGAGPIVAAMVGGVSVIRRAVVDHRGSAAAPAAI